MVRPRRVDAFVRAAEETIPPAGAPRPLGGTVPQVDVRVAGWENCWNDKVFKYQVPDTSGFLHHEDFKVNYQ